MDIALIQKDRLQVKVLSLQKVVYEGEAHSISSKNVKGTFDVLPLHTQLITICEKEVIIRPLEGEDISFQIVQGVIRVAENTVKIFLGFETLGNLGGVKV